MFALPKYQRLSVAPLESKPFEAPVVVAVGRAFVLIAPGFDLYDLRAISVRGVIRNPRKDRLRLPPRSHEDLYVLVQSRTTEIFRSACVGAAQTKKNLLALEPWADRPGLSLLFCSRHDKGAQKRYAQRAEDPLRVSVVSVGNLCPPFVECPARFTGLLA
ncbi:hypothetical protein CCACVL1_02786 [Corchorus capsularis]|uniref:Uncharacterized protein n=1 Tax=Corchorus capsularis TaxID=210143 RepID=A0A1R3K614_COCAP|nr:hypothetical protein CCACVL1_02786 [Corchorus capsularis]